MLPNYNSEKLLTGSMLEKLLTYNHHIGQFYMAHTRGGIVKGSKSGNKRKDGYIQIKINKRSFLAHRLAWVWMNGKWPDAGMDIDHINRDKSDNRISNLRLASRIQNSSNSNVKRNNKSGYPGVFWLIRKDGRSPRWTAFITIKGKRKKLGIFREKKDAIAARMAAEQKYHGEFARV